MACLTGLSATKVPARSSGRAWLIALLNSVCGNCFCTCSGSSDHAPKECDGNPRCGPRSARRLCSRSKSATLPCRRLRPAPPPGVPGPVMLRPPIPPLTPPPMLPIPPVPRWVSLSDSCWLSFSPARPLINSLAPLPVVGGASCCGVPDGGTGVRVAWCGGDDCLSAVNVLRRKRYPNRFHGVAEVIKNFLPRTAPQRLVDERWQPMRSSGRAAQSRRPPTNAPDDHAACFHATPQHAGRNPAHRSSPLPQGNTT